MKISLAFIAAFVGSVSAQRDLAESMSMSTPASDVAATDANVTAATYDGAVLEGVEADTSSDDPFDGMTSEDGSTVEGVEPDYSSDDPYDGMTSEDAGAEADAAETTSPAAGVTLSAVASAAALAGAAALF